MRRKTLILFNETTPFIDWATFDATGRITQCATAVALETLTTTQEKIIALIPSTQLTLLQVAIPSKRRQQIEQAVPYALEEQIAEEIEHLHFALGERETHTNFISVAVISRRVMEAYQRVLKTAKITPTLLTPDVFAVPKPHNGWGIIYYNERVLVRTGGQTGFAIEKENLAIVIQAALTDRQPPEQFTLYQDIQTETELLEILQSFDIPVIEQIHEHGNLGWFAQTLSKYKSLNLLQGKYQPTNKFIELWRPWQVTAWLLLGWILLFFLEQGKHYHQLYQQSQQLTTQIEQHYRQTFPEARRIVDPRAQMEQQLKQLQTQQNRQPPTENFLAKIQQISSPFNQLKDITIKQLNYQAGHFEIQLTAMHLQELETLKNHLNKLGFAVDAQIISHQQNNIDSQLSINTEKR